VDGQTDRWIETAKTSRALSQNVTCSTPTATLIQSSRAHNPVMHVSVSMKNVSCTTKLNVDFKCIRNAEKVRSTNLHNSMPTNQWLTD